jgi:spore coat polysaccharide biosynthesis protein SpsF
MDDLVVIVQARMSSVRFPGKSLYPIEGKPMIRHLLDSVRQIVPTDKLIIATSTGVQDDLLAKELCEFKVFRGDEENVANRFFQALAGRTEQYFARISGDSPLWDFRVLERVYQRRGDAEIVTTAGNYPSGFHVELTGVELFRQSYSDFSQQEDFEHLFPYFYRNADRFSIMRVECPFSFDPKCKFSVDTTEDLNAVERVLEKCPEHWTLSAEEKCKYA